MGKEKRPFCCHQNFVPNWLSAPARGYIHMAGSKLGGDLGETVSLQTQTSPYFQLREKFKCIEHIGKGEAQLKTSPWNQKIWGKLLLFQVLAWTLYGEKMYIKSDFKAIFLNLQQIGKVIRAFCWHQKFVPKGLSAFAPGLYTCIKSLKKVYKISFLFLNLQQMGKVIRAFCWRQKFVPKGLYALAPGLYTCIKSLKKVYKIRLRWDRFETCNIWAKRKGLSVVIKTLSQCVVCPCPGLYTCGKTWKKCRDCFKTCNKWAKGLSVDINICPQGVVCPCPGAIYMYKSIKIYTRTRCQQAFTGPLVLWFSVLLNVPNSRWIWLS